MPSIHSIFKDIISLSDREIEELFISISEILSLISMNQTKYNNNREQRFAKVVACLYCGSTNVIKHCKKNGVQRFRCKDCEKTFITAHLPPVANSHVSHEQCIDYAKCNIGSSGFKLSLMKRKLSKQDNFS